MALSVEQVRQIFEPLSIQTRQSEFFSHVADDVHWTVMGHSPMSGVYTSKEKFVESTLTLLRDKVLTEPLRLRLVNVLVAGDWATVEMRSIDAKCKNGMPYDMTYCWVCEFNQENIITTVRAYICTKLLTDAIEQNQ